MFASSSLNNFKLVWYCPISCATLSKCLLDFNKNSPFWTKFYVFSLQYSQCYSGKIRSTSVQIIIFYNDVINYEVISLFATTLYIQRSRRRSKRDLHSPSVPDKKGACVQFLKFRSYGVNLFNIIWIMINISLIN